MDKILLSIVADLLVNVAAGWFGLVFLVPQVEKRRQKRKFFVLTGNILFGIVCLEVAYLLRRLI